MRFIAALLAPYTPNISQDVYEQLNRSEKAVEVKLDELKWGEIPVGKITEKEKIKPVFLRLDSEIAGAAKRVNKKLFFIGKFSGSLVREFVCNCTKH